MAAIRPVQLEGPLTFSANVNINGGQLVEPDGSGPASPMLIKPCTANSSKCLGVAVSDAAAVGYVQGTIDAWGNPVYAAQFPPNEVAVAFEGIWRLTATGAIAFGDFVIAGVNGTVATAVGAYTAPISTTLSAATLAAATTFTAPVLIPVGSVVTIDTGAGQEIREVQIATGTTAPFTMTVAALTNAHASGVAATTNGTAVDATQIIGKCVDPLGIANGVRGKVVLGQVGMG